MTSSTFRLQGAKSRESVDSQFTEPDDDDDDEIDEEMRFFEACVECDDDSLYDIIHDGVTWDEVNKQDKSGRTGLSHACGSGFMPILQLLDGLEEIDPNLPDNDGNTPLIFAAQAGHDDIVNFLLRRFHRLKADHCNKLGFTALMKAAIQGRTRCAKLLLFAGASPNRRDHGRRLCAEEWARFCGRHACADAIQKYIRSTKYFFAKTFLLARDKWKSEPDLCQLQEPTAVSSLTSTGTGQQQQQPDESIVDSQTSSSSTASGQKVHGRRDSSGWIQRHLSLKRKKTQPLQANSDQPITSTTAEEEDFNEHRSSSTSPNKPTTWRQRSGSPLTRSGSVASTSRRRRSSQTGVGTRPIGRRSSCVPVCSSTLLLPMICVTSHNSTTPATTPTGTTASSCDADGEQTESPSSSNETAQADN